MYLSLRSLALCHANFKSFFAPANWFRSIMADFTILTCLQIDLAIDPLVKSRMNGIAATKIADINISSIVGVEPKL